ncbi:hypothetical protein [Microbulbifer epialgicus]|uniref:Uncharacterized protein n=1 Tax=Microbulbifer epialgicus TaxID=393907 RepID=A0ABV4P6L3_9GAMM
MAIYEIRRQNARYLAATFENRREFADAANMSRSQLSQRIGPNPTEIIGDSIARRIEKAANKEEGWLDREHPEVTGELEERKPPEGYIDPNELMIAVQEVWDAMEAKGEKITPPILISAALIYMRLRDARGEPSANDANQSITIAQSTIQTLDFNR